MKPIIAITTDSLIRPTSVINETVAPFIPRELVEGVIQAGGIPIALPFPENGTDADEIVKRVVDTFDGLVIPGGPDVDPTFFNEEPIPQIGRTNRSRDLYELALIKEAKAKGKAILGICRGLQIINVAFGGTVYQDLATQYPDVKIQHSQKAPGQNPTHYVTTIVNSRINKIVGDKSFVNSRHHQALKNIAANFQVTARSSDGVVEAIEPTDNSNILAVQWHPENMWQKDEKSLNLFQDFISSI